MREVDDELLQLDGQVRRPVAFDLSSAGGREHPTPQALAYRERTPEPVAAIRTCVDSAANRVGRLHASQKLGHFQANRFEGRQNALCVHPIVSSSTPELDDAAPCACLLLLAPLCLPV